MNGCPKCGLPYGDHYTHVDESIVLGLFGPAPTYQPPQVYITCPLKEVKDDRRATRPV